MKDADDKPAPPAPRSGEVRHDERGHAVWHWAADTARNAVTSTSQLLRKLDLSGLSLQDSETKKMKDGTKGAAPATGSGAPKPSARAVVAPAKRPVGGGFDPYEGRGAAAPARPAASVAARKPTPTSSAPRSSWWRRLFRRD